MQSSTNPFIFTSTASSRDEKQKSSEKLDDLYSEREKRLDSVDSDQVFEGIVPPFTLSEDSQKIMTMTTPQDMTITSTSGQNSSQTNLSSTIAGVVGGGASKLQALQKWFKGDSVDGKDSSNFRKRR